MSWLSMGTVSLAEDWRAFPEEAFNTETFRIISQTIPDPLINSAWLMQYYPIPEGSGELVPWKRIYPKAEPIIIQLPIPPEFREQGYFARTIFVKWRMPYYSVSWQIELQAFY